MTAWVVFAALLLVCGLGPRHHLVVCTGACCSRTMKVAAAPAGSASCSCCCHEGRAATEPAGTAARPSCDPGCCVDLFLDIELAPLPRADLAGIELPALCWMERAPSQGDEQVAGWPAWAWPHDTGPPRTDHRTALIASTTLRL